MFTQKVARSISQARQAKALLERSPMKLADFSRSRILATTPSSQDEVDKLHYQLTALLPTLTYAEAELYLRERFPAQHIYRGEHHLAVYAYNGGPCWFRAVEMFRN